MMPNNDPLDLPYCPILTLMIYSSSDISSLTISCADSEGGLGVGTPLES